MKQKDIVLIVVICFVSAVLAILLSNVVISNPDNRKQKAEVVDRISNDFQQPDNNYFNQNSVNPTQLIRIGDGQNLAPFNQ